MASWSAWGSDENSMGSVMVCSPFVVVVDWQDGGVDIDDPLEAGQELHDSVKVVPFGAAGRSDGPGQLPLGRSGDVDDDLHAPQHAIATTGFPQGKSLVSGWRDSCAVDGGR